MKRKHRTKMKAKPSQKLFTKTAKKVHRRNYQNENPLRGGIRL